jgi:serine/threonine protein kinase
VEKVEAGVKCPRCSLVNPPDSSFCKKCGSRISSFGNLSASSTKTYNLPLHELTEGSVFSGRYTISQKLGMGGMGVVYKAEDTKLKRTVALKLVRPEFTLDGEARERFVREAQVAASLDHPNICTVFEISESDGLDFITMAYIEGQSLDVRIESGPVDQKEAIDLMIQVAEGLQEAHEKGIIHRDIKSANIMVTTKGQAKIMDFGLAKLTEGPQFTKTTKIVGTVAYMSPEQAKGEKVDIRSDLWSLGVVLYELLAGQLPFKRGSAAGVLYGIVNENPKPIWQHQQEVSNSLAAIVERCLEKNPSKRYQTAGELARDLKSVRHSLSQESRKARRLHIPASKRRKSLRQAGVLVGSACLVLALLWVLPASRREIRNRLGWGASRVDEASPAALPSVPSLKPPAVMESNQDGSWASINAGSDAGIRVGQTGRVYFNRQVGPETSQAVMAQFIVNEVFPAESKVGLTEVGGEVKPGYLVEFDKEPRGALVVKTIPPGAGLYIDDQYKAVTDFTAILNPGTYNLKIKAKNYEEKNDTIKITAGAITPKTYSLTILRPRDGTLKVESTPAGAEVLLGKEEKLGGLTPFEKVLPPGLYRVKIKLPNYEAKSYEIPVNPGEISTKNVILDLMKGTLWIDSTPIGADVFLGERGHFEGKTPFRTDYPLGEVLIKLKKDGFEDIQETIAVDPGDPVKRNFTLKEITQPASSKYSLSIRTVPSEARVFINDNEEGRSPLEFQFDKASKVSLRVMKEGFKSEEETFVLDGPRQFDYVLMPLDKGTFEISTDPGQAIIEIDGKPLQKRFPPVVFEERPEGQYTFTFIFEEDGVYEKKYSVKEGGSTRVHFKVEDWMREQKALYEFTAYSRLDPLKLRIDNRTVGDGNVPPQKRFWVEQGSHSIKFILRDKALELADLELKDYVEAKQKKRVNVVYELADEQSLGEVGIPEELKQDGENDWVLIKSGPPVEAEVDGSPLRNLNSSSAYTLLKPMREKHKISLGIRNPKENQKVEVWVYMIEKKKLYKIVLTIVLA